MNIQKKWILGIGAAISILLAGAGIFFALRQPGQSPETSKIEAQPLDPASMASGAEGQEAVLPNLAVQEKAEITSMLTEKRPALVTLRGSADGTNYTVGSGFLLDIQSDKLYICTSRHVIENCDDWEIGFYDGTTLTGKKVGVSQTYDVGIVMLEKAQVPSGLFDNLFTLDVDLEYWGTLEGKQAKAGFLSMYQEQGAEIYVGGQLLNTLEEYHWDSDLRHSLFQMTFVDGDSGSAIFDDSGHLISMVHGTAYTEDASSTPQSWGIPLSAIAISYIEIVDIEEF